jgi:hypothetical protein
MEVFAMSKVIRISESTYMRLESLVKGFDTPGNVIERLLDFYERQLKVPGLQTERINPPTEALPLVMTYGEATAEAEYKNGNVNLLPGSTIRKEMHESLPDHIRDKRNETLSKRQIVLSEDGDLYEVKAPIIFGSPSAAAQFVAGCSVSGPREWQVKGKGCSLKLWLEKRK